MPPLPGKSSHKAQFTRALYQYNLSDDSDRREHFARRIAKYIRLGEDNGFTVEQVTQGQSYPADEVQKILREDPGVPDEPDVSEDQAAAELAQLVDTSSVKRRGAGTGSYMLTDTDVPPTVSKWDTPKGTRFNGLFNKSAPALPTYPFCFWRLEQTTTVRLWFWSAPYTPSLAIEARG
jgi:hypothetical protein